MLPVRVLVYTLLLLFVSALKLLGVITDLFLPDTSRSSGASGGSLMGGLKAERRRKHDHRLQGVMYADQFQPVSRSENTLLYNLNKHGRLV